MTEIEEIDHPDVQLDPVQLYLNEIGRVPLLSAAEEIELAQQMEQGKIAALRLAEGGTLAPEVYAALHAAVLRAHEARGRLIASNLRLVFSIAKNYANRGLPLMDLIQEGNIGLMKAVEKFDISKGNRFSTYATWWIRQAVTRSLAEKARMIRLPVHVGDSRLALIKVVNRLCIDLERQPTQGEIAEAMGITVEKVRMLLGWMQDTASLNKPLRDDEESAELGELLAVHGEDTERTAFQAHMRECLSEALAGLEERERAILILRYGLDGYGQKRTLEEVGVLFRITRERTRQIEAGALRRLRHPHLGAGLREFVREL